MKIKLVGDNLLFNNKELQDLSEVENFAKKLKLDLVCVNDKSNIPVYKIFDLKKYKYDQKKRKKLQNKQQKKIIVKEIKLSPNIASNDFNFKLNNAIKFLNKGFNLKLTMYFKGRTIKFKEIGMNTLNKFIKALESLTISFTRPLIKGRQINCLIRKI